MRWLVVLMLLPMAHAVPARATCDDAFLASLDPGVGEVLAREALPSQVVEDVEVEISRRSVPCAPDETDDACVSRASAEQVDLPGPGQRLTVHLEGPFKGVRATFDDGDGPFEQDFESYEATADWMQGEQTTRPGLVLTRAEQRRDPEKRTAVARAVEDREQTVNLGPGTRMRIRLTTSFPDALRAFRAIESVNVIQWDSDVDGTVTVVIRCR